MGLDVYVGPLTRYYTGDWETVVQRWARETGRDVQVVRPGEDASNDPAQVREVVMAWRDGLSAALAEHGVPPLDWEEAPGGEYFTDKPAWDCYSALLVWAAHDEHPETPLPDTAPEQWASYPPIVAAQEPGGTRYAHLLHGAELWLPAFFDITFAVSEVTGRKVGVGSVERLHQELLMLNERTWRATKDEIAGWRREGADFRSPTETSARFGFAVFLDLAAKAVMHHLPMKLDY
jgi:hypothetical protein